MYVVGRQHTTEGVRDPTRVGQGQTGWKALASLATYGGMDGAHAALFLCRTMYFTVY